MKQNTFGMFLLVVVFLGALTAGGLSYTYVRYVREARDLQYQTTVINRNRTMFQNLANDAAAYGQQNPAIRPILERVGIRMQQQDAAGGANQ